MTDVIEGLTKPVEEPTKLVDTLVGEGRKYASVEDLAKGRVEADKHIEQIEAENKRMVEDLAKLEAQVKESTTLDSVVQALKPATVGEGEDNQDSFNPSDIESLVAQTIDKRNAAEKASANRKLVNDTLISATGGDAVKAGEVLKDRLSKIGMDAEQFSNLSHVSPEAALKLIDINNTNYKRADSPSGMAKSDSVSQSSGGVRNKAYYDALKKSMGLGKFYADTKLQKQYQDDYAANQADWLK